MAEVYLVDRVRSSFIHRLLESMRISSKSKSHLAKLALNTPVIHDLLEDFLFEHLTLYLSKKTTERELQDIQVFMHEYLFSTIPEEDLIRFHKITKSYLEKHKTLCFKGFKELYGEDIT